MLKVTHNPAAPTFQAPTRSRSEIVFNTNLFDADADADEIDGYVQFDPRVPVAMTDYFIR
jgi:hypothetical protein